MKVKICGITNLADSEVCVNNGADAVGFIFYKKSKRYINPERAKNIISSLPFFIMKIGVFVNESIEEVNKIAEEIGLNGVQLHGDETHDYIEQIRYPVIKSFRVDDNFNYAQLKKFSNCSFLLDSKDDKQFGGTGQNFNWDDIPVNLRNKVILAGGISLNNIEYIYKNIKPAAVDLSSSLEIEPGIKDHQKVINFLNLVKNLRNK